MTEEQILEYGHFVRHVILPNKEWERPKFSGFYVLKEDTTFSKYYKESKDFRVSIETQIIQGETRFWGKVGGLRLAINTQAQYEQFWSMALDSFMD